ncbi:LON peptidase substrate-binding domain-containing protein [Pseudoroseicyclus tamaricis]|uniref:ATP-dependent protease n=1 Tax=Pseudoroseicyclus tamaricis TaxID=2705421 RepID=A0A6B2K234_9RHOB|nr:LON peptidase substrate-binding domain-containing protein [Pseudoroseicyclus tamaricis]NDV02584.1 ATP-dependent protease [Pseudoroseicyclus tamaricis]
MSRTADLPETIALFPLPGAVLLPRARLPLQIFEPRYLAMMDDVLKTPERLIGMIQPTRDDSGLHSVGCAGRVTSFNETDDGRYMITLMGRSRFRLVEEVEGFTPYRRAKVDWAEFRADRGPAETDAALDRTAFLGLLKRFFDSEGLSTDWDALEAAEDEIMINALSMLCPFEPEDKQALLEAPALTKRREVLEALIEYSLRGGHGEERMQ